MDIIENIKGTVTKTGKIAVQKTKDLAGIAKLTTEIEETKKLITDVYAEIGKKYCDMHADGTADPDFAVSVATVENLNERLEALRKERLALSGRKLCENCGKGAKATYEFCPFCGAKLPEVVVEEETEDVTDADLTDDAEDEETEE